MTRVEAILHIMHLEFLVDHEFSASSQETASGDREVRDALNVLGISDEEIDNAYDQITEQP